MPWEDIGSVGTGELPEGGEWIDFCLELARGYIALMAGKPPAHSEIEIMDHEHELRSYPSLALRTEEPGVDLDIDYVVACQNALAAFDAAVDWEALKAHWQGVREEHGQSARDVDDDDIGQLNASA